MSIKLGTRGSPLSLAQTSWVLDELKNTNPSLTFEIEKITTKGDTDTRPLFAMEQKGIFEKEIDRAVSEKQVDFAVHSMKDVPSDLDSSLTIACVPKRESVNDVLITNDGFSLDSIPSGSTVGSSSLRRAVQISRKRPDLNVKPIRGNIETRINKVAEKKIDGIYLECYQDLAHQQLEKIRNQAIQQWQLTECNIIHRIGSLDLGEKIVLVITSSKHRANSINACEYVIDNLKANVAFWKFNIFGKNQEAVESKKKDLDKFLQWSNIVKTN